MRYSATTLIAIAISMIVGLEQSVLAADFPARLEYKVPVVAALSQWTGCYIGRDIGAGWLATGSGANTISERNGLAAGGQFGCDYQAGTMLFGVRSQINWADLKSIVWIDAGTSASTASVTSSWHDLLTAHVGYAVQPEWLLYFKVGAGWRNLDQKLFEWTGTRVGQVGDTRVGWTAGIGSEYKLTRNWSVFLEYKYADFGTGSANIVVPGGLFSGSTKSTVQAISGGVNFRF